MAADDAIRAQSSYHRAARWRDIRGQNSTDQTFDLSGAEVSGALIANAEYGDVDTVAVASADWGPKINVEGYERLSLFLNHTAGTDTTTVEIEAQVSHDGCTWYDYYEIGAAGAVAPVAWTVTTAADLMAGWDLHPIVGRFMRFRVGTTGANRAGSRISLFARRIMDAL